MSKRKWESSGIEVSWGHFQKMSDPMEIIYDTSAHRATTVGILWGMPYRTVRIMLSSPSRYHFAKLINKGALCQTQDKQ